jgi:hypothetical protein
MAVKRRDPVQSDSGEEPLEVGERPAAEADQDDADGGGESETDQDDAEGGGESEAEAGASDGDSDDPAPAAPAQEDDPRPRVGRSAPLWILVLFLGGMGLVFLGERVLESLETASTIASTLGVIAVVVGTTLRFSPRFRVGGQRQQIESWLGALSVTGLVGLLLYFATTDWLAERLGLFSLGETTFDRVMGLLTVSWVVLIVISVLPMVFAETAAYPMRHAVRPESRRVRFATLSGVSLALALVYCALFVYAARGVDWSADYSYFKTSEPSESTRKIVQTLDEPVLVRAFFPDVNEVRDEVERYLKNLAKDNPKLQVEIKDRLAEPKISRDLRITQDGTIVLTQGETHEQVRVGSDIDKAREKLRKLDGDFQEKLLKLVRSRRTAYLTVGHGEINDTRGKTKLETREATVVKELLRRQNFTVKDLGLAQGLGRDVPDDADLVLVLGPAEPIAPEEIGSLKRYAERGGKLFVALDPNAETLTEALLPSQLAPRAAAAGTGSDEEEGAAAAPVPSASAAPEGPEAGAEPAATTKGGTQGDAGSTDEAAADDQPQPATVAAAPTDDPNVQLAAALGLAFDSGILTNDRFHMRLRYNLSDRTRIGSNRFSSHAAVTTLSRNASRGVGVVFDGAGSLDKLPGTKAKVDFAVRSMDGTFRDLNNNYRYDPTTDKRGNFNIAAAVTAPVKGASAQRKPAKPKPAGEAGDDQDKSKPPPKEMRAFVVADAAAFSDMPMSRFLGNQVLFVDAVRWLAGEESIMGEISSEEDLRIEHTKQEDLVWFYSSIIGVPALVLGLGLWFGRRPVRRAKKGARR